MSTERTRTWAAHLARVVGAAAVLATGADHLYEYSANNFASVPTIGPLFLLNFIAATAIGVGLLLPLRRIVPRLADPLRLALVVAGIGIAATSLLGLWISETSSLFGFTDNGLRTTIVVAIAAEAVAILALTAYVPLAGVRLPRRLVRLRSRPEAS